MLPELANLAQDDAEAWRWYLTMSELSKALLCATIAHYVPTARIYAMGACVWYMTQTADEYFNGNLLAEQTWEYPLLAGFAVALWLLKKRTT